MKRCPHCHARFDDGREFCAHDGAALVSASDPMLGRTLADRYKLVQRIGVGGMGTVYRAQHLLLRRDVALKLLSSELTRDPVMRERFLREAQATHMLRHPNIVEMIDVAVDGARVFLVMELLEGSSLASWLGSGPLELVRSLRVLRPVVSALARAHGLGVVHRDIKPENVFISGRPGDDGAVKVLDFGIAYLRHEARLTAPGELFGTPEYLAPELARGDECVPASDLYALGVMLFEMLTGALPFDGDLSQLVAHHRATPPPSARARNPEVPPEVDALVMQLMSKSPAARPESAEALGARIDALLEQLDPSTSMVVPRLSSEALDAAAHRTEPRATHAPPSLATLRQQRATLAAAVTAAYGDTPPAWVADSLRALGEALAALDRLDAQRRDAVRELSARSKEQQLQREALQDALGEVAREVQLAESALAGATAALSEMRANDVAARNRIAMLWNDLGPPPPHAGVVDAERAALMEALGAAAADWRNSQELLAQERARHADAVDALARAVRVRGERERALNALEAEGSRRERELLERTAETAAAIDARHRELSEHTDALGAHLIEIPGAGGWISWIPAVARTA